MGIFRMYTGSDGESIIEELQQDNPILETLKTCTGCSLQINEPNEYSDFHPAPRRRWMTMLSGQVKGVARHVDHFEGVVTNVHCHAVLEGDDGGVDRISFQQLGLPWTHAAHSGQMLFQIGFQYTGPYPLVGYDGGIKIGVAGPVVPMGFSIDDVFQLAMLLHLSPPFQGIGGLLRAVDHDHPL